MRTAIISALIVLFALILLPSPAAGQSGSTPAPLHLSLLPAPPLSSTTPAATIAPGASDSREGLLPNLTNELSPNPFGNQQLQIVRPNRLLPPNAPPPARSCAHILIRHVPSLDANAISTTPKGTVDRMPAAKGLPVCREDVR